MTRVLIVEGGHAPAQTVDSVLRAARMTTQVTVSGQDALDMLAVYDHDIVLLELVLPDMTGHEVLRKARAAGFNAPVVILTGVDDIDNKLKAYGLGADDYITKPYHREELVARILAVVRRSKGHPEPTIKTGEIVLNLEKHTVTVRGRNVHMTPKEHRMLELLSLRRGTVVTRDAIMDHLYGGVNEPEANVLAVFMTGIRKKLDAATGGKCGIRTIWGRGYMLEDPNNPMEI